MKMNWLLSQEFLKKHPVEASHVLVGLTIEETEAYLEHTDVDTAVAVLQQVSPRIGANCLAAWLDERVEAVMERLPMAPLARVLRMMSSEEQERILALAPKGVAGSLERVLRYPGDSAISWTELEPFFFTKDLRVGHVWKLLRRERESIGPYIYVVDREGSLVGVTSLGEVFTAQPRLPLETIMRHPVERIVASDRRPSVANHPAWQKFPALPVVDEDGNLLGRIRYSTLRDLEQGMRAGGVPNTWRHVALSLAELYWVSTSNLVRDMSGMVTLVPALTRGKEGSDEA